MSFESIETRALNRNEHDDLREGLAPFKIRPGAVVGIYVYCCGACNKTISSHWEHWGTPLNPGVDEWQKINRYGGDTYYCPDHKIEFLTIIDDKVQK